ncbi:hypothetical protein PybrP1_004900 [[Pythium] brassicae (nom. inval.)]|nr:hypothetical protein PybrP1_004900 [[Pythium] brassicae (nom. inval.)]
MDDEFAMSSLPPSPKRISNRYARLSRKESPEDVKHRARDEMHLTREFIDFDVIKGSAFFHTKPSSHDKKLMKEGITRALFVPFHGSFWKQKPYFYEASTALYLLHFGATCVYLARPRTMSVINSFEVLFPIVLLVLVAIGYGRVTSTLLAGDADPVLVKLLSPTKCAGTSTAASASPSAARSSHSPTRCATSLPSLASLSSSSSGIGSDLAESENSDGTDSEEESGNSSSSSDETDQPTSMFPPASAPVSVPPPLTFPSMPRAAHPRRASLDRDHTDPFARRRVTVCVWENGEPMKKAMSITELRNTILARVKATPPRMVYRKIAHIAALTLSLVPVVLRCFIKCQELECLGRLQEPVEAIYVSADADWISRLHKELSLNQLVGSLTGVNAGPVIVAVSCMLSTYLLAFIIFSALADAEVTYHRRFLYAKCFTALTSSRRSRLMKLPHFRLKNVVNIKAWIALRGGRTWLKRQGRQRAADEIVSTSFLINLVMLVVMGMQAVSEGSGTIQQQSLIHIEVTMWCLLSSVFMLRFMMLGSNINKKYQNTSLLLTEQMNVYLRLLVKPHKKEKLLVSNNVLKLASKLLKELNSPNKVSGLTMNPLLYNITRVVVLSAFSSTASEFFGFKLKLWKMKSM